jgi:NAD(P)-dependent dehydrogenase (short-subunit alcohol dehydrogenase family)
MLGHNITRPGFREETIGRTALGEFGQPCHIADAALLLLEMVWVTSQTIMADGGASLSTGRSNWLAVAARDLENQ